MCGILPTLLLAWVQKRAEKCTHATDFRSLRGFWIPSVRVGRKICPHALEKPAQVSAGQRQVSARSPTLQIHSTTHIQGSTIHNCIRLFWTNSEVSGIYRSLSSDWLRSLRSAWHRSWQIRQPAAQSKLRELRQRARSACFVPVMRKMQNNRDFTLSPLDGPLPHEKSAQHVERFCFWS